MNLKLRVKLLLFLLHCFFINAHCQTPCSGSPASNTIIPSSTLVCAGSSITLNMVNANALTGLLYTWKSSTVSGVGPWVTYTTSYITNSVVTQAINLPTWFSVVITCTNANQSTTSPSTFVTIATNTITFNSSTTCSGSQASITANSIGNINWYSSLTSTTAIASGSTLFIPNAIAGTFLYYAEASNACNFSPLRVGISLTVNPSPTISVSNVTLCNTQNTYTIVPTGANTYTFSSGSSIVSPTTTSIYTVSGTSTLACISNVTLMVTKLTSNPPIVSLNSGSICPFLSFTFTPSGANSYSIQGGSFIVSPSVTSLFTVVGTSTNGCSANASAIVYVFPDPTITIGNPTICAGQSCTLYPSGAITYTYAGGGPVVSPLVTSNYYIIGTDVNGCTTSNTKMVTVYVDVLTPVLTVNNGTICNGGYFIINPSGANTYTYSSGTNIVTPSISTVYTITGRYFSSVCTTSVFSTVVVNSVAELTVTNVPPIICLGQTATITANGALSYTWNSSFPANFLIVSPFSTTIYSVTGIDGNGCASSTIVTEYVNACLNVHDNRVNQSLYELFPNPNNGSFTVLSSEIGEMLVYSLTGNLLLQQALLPGENKVEIFNLKEGIYQVQIKLNSGTQHLKIIKN